jgi:hypothetical protein
MAKSTKALLTGRIQMWYRCPARKIIVVPFHPKSFGALPLIVFGRPSPATLGRFLLN